MLGPGILGKEAAEAERLKQQNGAGGGAIQLGKHFADKEAERVRAIQSAIVPFEPAEPANRTMKTPVKASKARTASANRTADVPPAPARPAPAGESYSEKEIEDMLDEDPNLWDRVMGLEAARPGGPRKAVARMVLMIAPLATIKPVPSEVLADLEKIAPSVAPVLAK
jgi:hypothetical protein